MGTGFCQTTKWIGCVVSVLSLSHVWLFEIPRTVASRLSRPWVFPGRDPGVGSMCVCVHVCMCIDTCVCLPPLAPLSHPPARPQVIRERWTELPAVGQLPASSPLHAHSLTTTLTGGQMESSSTLQQVQRTRVREKPAACDPFLLLNLTVC